MSALQEAVEILGSQSALARAIGKKQQDVHHWLKVNKVPAEHVIAVEKATGGKVKRHELRSDIYPIE